MGFHATPLLEVILAITNKCVQCYFWLLSGCAANVGWIARWRGGGVRGEGTRAGWPVCGKNDIRAALTSQGSELDMLLSV